jgi:hypothetical protein
MPDQIIQINTESQSVQQAAIRARTPIQQSQKLDEHVRDAYKELLKKRYRKGREVYNALKSVEDETTKTDFCEAVAKGLSCSSSHVQHHIDYAERCAEAFGDRAEPGLALAEWWESEDRKLSWSRIVHDWVYDSQDGEQSEADSTRERQLRKVERLIERLDSASEALAEQYLDRADSMDDSERKAVEGVLTRARQALQDERHRMETLPIEDEERVECEPYRRWVADHACCHCGVINDTVVLHHPEHVYADSGGHATKISDFLGVPLCFDCHQKAEGPEERFWKQSQSDPREVAARLQSEWNAKLTQTK